VSLKSEANWYKLMAWTGPKPQQLTNKVVMMAYLRTYGSESRTNHLSVCIQEILSSQQGPHKFFFCWTSSASISAWPIGPSNGWLTFVIRTSSFEAKSSYRRNCIYNTRSYFSQLNNNCFVYKEYSVCIWKLPMSSFKYKPYDVFFIISIFLRN